MANINLEKAFKKGWGNSLDEIDMDVTEQNYLIYLHDEEQFKNYCDDLIYCAEKNIRKFIEKKSEDYKWKTVNKYRQYTLGQLVEICTGQAYTKKKNQKLALRIRKLGLYYCSRTIQGGNVVIKDEKNGKEKVCHYGKAILYRLSNWNKIKDMPPYSLRLRQEWLSAKNIKPNEKNMEYIPPYKDHEKVGNSIVKNYKSRIRAREISERNKLLYAEQLKKEKGDRAYREYLSRIEEERNKQKRKVGRPRKS